MPPNPMFETMSGNPGPLPAEGMYPTARAINGVMGGQAAQDLMAPLSFDNLKDVLLQRAHATLNQAAVEHQAVAEQLAARQAARAAIPAWAGGTPRNQVIRVRPEDVIHESAPSTPAYQFEDLPPEQLAERIAGGTTNPWALGGLSPWTAPTVMSKLPGALHDQAVDADVQREAAASAAGDAVERRMFEKTGTLLTSPAEMGRKNDEPRSLVGGDFDPRREYLRYGTGPADRVEFQVKDGVGKAAAMMGKNSAEANTHVLYPDDAEDSDRARWFRRVRPTI